MDSYGIYPLGMYFFQHNEMVVKKTLCLQKERTTLYQVEVTTSPVPERDDV